MRPGPHDLTAGLIVSKRERVTLHNILSPAEGKSDIASVSYTHLTLPTKRIV